MILGRILIALALPVLVLAAAHELTQWIAALSIINRETNTNG